MSKSRSPRIDSDVAIATIRQLLEEQGARTIRGIGYLLVARHSDLMPDGKDGRMSFNNLKRLGGWVRDARRDGRIPWDWVLEEGRQLEAPQRWERMRDFLHWYAEHPPRLNHWGSQPHDVEIWCEKATLAGLLRPAAWEFGVGYRSVHGSVSETTIHAVSELTAERQRPRILLYCGDFDPKGMEMSERDLPTRFALPCHTTELGRRPSVTIRRIAVLLTQVRRPDLRPYLLPVKASDGSTPQYVRQYGRWGVGD